MFKSLLKIFPCLLVSACSGFTTYITTSPAPVDFPSSGNVNKCIELDGAMPIVNRLPQVVVGNSIWNISTNAVIELPPEIEFLGVGGRPGVVGFPSNDLPIDGRLSISLSGVSLSGLDYLRNLDGSVVFSDGRKYLPVKREVRYGVAMFENADLYAAPLEIREVSSVNPNLWRNILTIKFSYDLPANPRRCVSIIVGELTGGRIVSFGFLPVIVKMRRNP